MFDRCPTDRYHESWGLNLCNTHPSSLNVIAPMALTSTLKTSLIISVFQSRAFWRSSISDLSPFFLSKTHKLAKFFLQLFWIWDSIFWKWLWFNKLAKLRRKVVESVQYQNCHDCQLSRVFKLLKVAILENYLIAPCASIVYHFWYLSSFSKSYFSSSEMDVEVLTWLTASIMNWKWVWKSQMGESFVRGEPREVKKLIRVRKKYRKQILVKFDNEWMSMKY